MTTVRTQIISVALHKELQKCREREKNCCKLFFWCKKDGKKLKRNLWGRMNNRNDCRLRQKPKMREKWDELIMPTITECFRDFHWTLVFGARWFLLGHFWSFSNLKLFFEADRPWSKNFHLQYLNPNYDLFQIVKIPAML